MQKNKKINFISKRIKSRKSNITVIGLGYVGLPLALGFCEKGIRTFGFDININIITDIEIALKKTINIPNI